MAILTEIKVRLFVWLVLAVGWSWVLRGVTEWPTPWVILVAAVLAAVLCLIDQTFVAIHVLLGNHSW